MLLSVLVLGASRVSFDAFTAQISLDVVSSTRNFRSPRCPQPRAIANIPIPLTRNARQPLWTHQIFFSREQNGFEMGLLLRPLQESFVIETFDVREITQRGDHTSAKTPITPAGAR